jgi:hypothetical protein
MRSFWLLVIIKTVRRPGRGDRCRQNHGLVAMPSSVLLYPCAPWLLTFRYLDQLRKGRLIAYGHVGQNLAIELNASLFQSVYEATV